jgi:signal transduction histidine kinase/ligand-binding sensor domain-containing protein/CheY-like chemotaxis protein
MGKSEGETLSGEFDRHKRQVLGFYRFAALLISFLTVALICSDGEAATADRYFLSEYVQTRFFESNAIPVTTTNQVLQTDDGYIWIASYDGLARFDGQRSRIFGEEDGSLPTNNIYTIFEDSLARLWVGTNDSGLAIYENEQFTFLSEADGVPSPSIRSITEDLRGNIYVATTAGLAMISKDKTVSEVRTPDGKPILATNIAISSLDELWCILADGHVIVVKDKAVTSAIKADDFGDFTFQAVYCTKNGFVYLGTSNGNVFVWDPAATKFARVKAGDINNINAFYEDTSSRVWVCGDNGIGYFDDGRFSELGGAIVNNSVENMTEDYEGNYWFVSSRSGVLLLSRVKLKNVFFAYDLADRTVNSIMKYHENFYVGTDKGLLILGPDGEEIDDELTKMLDGVRIRALGIDSQDYLWIGTYQNYGVIRYKNGEWTSIGVKNGLIDERVRAIVPRKNGEMIVTTSNGLTIARGDKVVQNFTVDDGLTMPVILNAAETKDGTIYAGSDGGGIYMIKDGVVIGDITTKDGLAAGVILRITIDESSGGMWVSTGNALSFVDDSGVRIIDKLSGYDNNIFDIMTIGDDELWLMSSSGVYICSRSNLLSDDPLRLEFIGKQDGLTSPPTANALNYISPEGVLYISSTRGIHSIDTENVYKNTVEPKLVIDSVTIDDDVFESPDITETIIVPAYARRIIIDFALLSYIKSDKNKVSVFLEGFDTSPSIHDMTQATAVSFTNLVAGEYALHLIGTNAYDVETEEIILRIKKNPKLFEMPLFWVGLAIVLLASAFFIAKTYHKRKTLQKDKLLIGVNKAASLLIADISDDMELAVWRALKVLGESVGARAAFLWRNGCSGETPKTSMIILWLEHESSSDDFRPTFFDVPVENLLGTWKMETGPKSVSLDVKQLSDAGVDAEIFGEIQYFTTIPIIMQEGLWGFIGFANRASKQFFSAVEFSPVQIDILASGGLLVASAIMRGEMVLYFIEAKEKALAGTKAKSDFLARMSHEIRTPMNAVIGLGELAIREYGNPKGLEHISGINQAGLSLLSIINDILDFSKIESGNFQLVPAPYETSSLLNNVITIIGIRLKDKPIRFITDIDSSLPAVMIGDESRIRQVLLNLLSNALKYTNKGFVKLSASGELIEDSAISLTFVVEDSGIGIKQQDIGKLFKDFVRIDEDKNRNIEGTGLGLSITRSLCRMMGGDVTVKSEYGAGSIFTAALVQRVGNAAMLGSMNLKNPVFGKGADAAFTAPSFHVLIVDDISANIMVIEGLLATYEIKTSSCLSGMEAIALIKNQHFDLVFMDHMMPGLDGIETTTAIRSEPGDYFSQLPIIALTANAMSGMREMFLKNGFNDYLSKPIEVSKLAEIMERWVPVDKRGESGLKDETNETFAPDVDPDIDGLDYDSGSRRYGGSFEYLKVLRSYREDIPNLIDRLRNPAADSLNDYVIAVHGLKGASMGICADKLADKAQFLELQAKDGNFVSVLEENESLITMAESFLADLDEFFKDVSVSGKAGPLQRERRPSPDAALLQKMHVASLRSITSEMESIQAKLERFEYDSDADLVKWLRERIDNLDYGAISERLGKN